MPQTVTLTVIRNCGDFDRYTQFSWQDFFVSAWWSVWPDGMQLQDDDGTVYTVYSFKRPRGKCTRQGLRATTHRIEPKDGTGDVRRIPLQDAGECGTI